MNTTKTISINKIRPFEGHPYKILDNEEMDSLIESVQENGVMTPLIVRPLEGTRDEYEIISGHRRYHAAQKAGLTELPVIIRAVSRDEAAIMLVDSNLHREHILPSEKAFAYKMKMEAMKRQGRRSDLTSSQVGTKLRTDEQIAQESGESRNQIQRYIRLTNLIPGLLDLMDEGKIALSVGVELSYLSETVQRELLEIIQREDCTPSYSQANRLHKAFVNCSLTRDGLAAVMSEEKANQRDRIVLPRKAFDDVLPKGYSKQDAEAYILDAVRHYNEYRHRRRERER